MQKQHFLGLRAPFVGTIFALKRVLHTGHQQIAKKTVFVVFWTKQCQKRVPGPGGNNSLFRSFSRHGGHHGPPGGTKGAQGAPQEAPDPPKQTAEKQQKRH